MEQSWTQSTRYFPTTIDVAPLIQITDFSYYDADNVLQELDSNLWTAVCGQYLPCVIDYLDTLPELYDSREDAVIVSFTAGYVEVPPYCLQLVKTLTRHFFLSQSLEIPDKFLNCLAVMKGEF